jgi:glycosyltransferase involved in cell wall biosynthesis
MGFSLVIPTYEQRGHGAFMLTSLLNSIARVRRPVGDFEIVISDNSADDLILKSLGKYRTLPITYHHNPVRGASENINNAIDLAKYDKIKIMCQDDLIINPSALTIMDAALDLHGWVVCASKIMKEGGMYTRTAKAKFIPGALDKNTVGMPSCVAFRKNDKRFDPTLKTFTDLWFYHELYFTFGMPLHIDTALVAQRYWHGSQSRNQPPSHLQDSIIMKKRFNEFQTSHTLPGLR